MYETLDTLRIHKRYKLLDQDTLKKLFNIFYTHIILYSCVQKSEIKRFSKCFQTIIYSDLR